MIDQNWQDKLKALKMTMPDSVDTDDSDMAPELDENTVATNLCPKLDIVYERKGRAGKSVTIICGFSSGIDDETISALASRLRKRLGTGGSARGGEILIQGDRRTDVLRLLQEEGYKARII